MNHRPMAFASQKSGKIHFALKSPLTQRPNVSKDILYLAVISAIGDLSSHCTANSSSSISLHICPMSHHQNVPFSKYIQNNFVMMNVIRCRQRFGCTSPMHAYRLTGEVAHVGDPTLHPVGRRCLESNTLVATKRSHPQYRHLP